MIRFWASRRHLHMPTRLCPAKLSTPLWEEQTHVSDYAAAPWSPFGVHGRCDGTGRAGTITHSHSLTHSLTHSLRSLTHSHSTLKFLVGNDGSLALSSVIRVKSDNIVGRDPPRPHRIVNSRMTSTMNLYLTINISSKFSMSLDENKLRRPYVTLGTRAPPPPAAASRGQPRPAVPFTCTAAVSEESGGTLA